MFVILKHGKKQYWAESNSVLALDKIDAEVGDSVELKMVGQGNESNFESKDGVIKAEIIKHYRDDKIIVFKKKRRHHYERKHGHRQEITQVKIQDLK